MNSVTWTEKRACRLLFFSHIVILWSSGISSSSNCFDTWAYTQMLGGMGGVSTLIHRHQRDYREDAEHDSITSWSASEGRDMGAGSPLTWFTSTVNCEIQAPGVYNIRELSLLPYLIFRFIAMFEFMDLICFLHQQGSRESSLFQ